jgi:dTDP-4-dehydrorhamnose 3,5-epimerase
MKVVAQPFEGIMVMEPDRFEDSRGFFLESFEQERYRALGILESFVQDNHSHSVKNVLRGLHFTKKRPQSQILTVIRGTIFDVVVDIRKESSTYGKWFGAELSDEGPRQIYMAHGFAHGFCVLSDYVDLHYKVSQRYDPSDEIGLRWNDPQIGIEWKVGTPVISDRDRNHPLLSELSGTGNENIKTLE